MSAFRTQGSERRKLSRRRRRWRLAAILGVQRAQVPQLSAGPDGRRGVRRPGGALGVRLLELAGAADGGGGEEDLSGAATLEDCRGEQVSPVEEKASSRKSDAFFTQSSWDIKYRRLLKCCDNVH